MAQRRVLLLINRHCRGGAGELSPLFARLAERGLELTIHYPESRAATGELIREHAGRVDAVVLGGGDGTLHNAIEALLDAGLPFGILPLGTANDLARSLGIPLDPLQACEVIAAGREHRIDLGKVNEVYFFNAASIGLGVEVTRRLSRQLKGRWGVFSYAHALVQALRSLRPFAVEVSADGVPRVLRSIQITVGNGRFYGGGMTVDANAALDDQRLHLYSLRPQSLWRLIALAPALRRGRQRERPEVEVCEGTRIEVRTRRPMAVSVDGEIGAATPAVFSVLAQAVRVFAPDPAQAEGLIRAS